MQMTSGNLFLIFIQSVFMLLFGCTIGMHWHGSPGTAFCLTILGAALWVLHELITVLLWFGATAFWTRMVAKNGK
jgi:multisubunit Na+/H+ antiporter MnhB subunit